MISNTTVQAVYTANGNTRRWPIPFVFDENESVHLRISDGVEEREIAATDFTVDSENLVVIYPKASTAPAVTAGFKVAVYRETDVTQEVDFTNQGGVWPETVEAALDKLTEITQEHEEELTRCAKVTLTDDETPEEYSARLWAAADAAVEAAANAATSEGNAATSAANAATSATTAATEAANAAASATTAAAEADAAAASAEAAAASEAELAAAVALAQASATNAGNSAASAGTYATSAGNYNSSAQLAAQAAQQSAGNAATSAATASAGAATVTNLYPQIHAAETSAIENISALEVDALNNIDARENTALEAIRTARDAAVVTIEDAAETAAEQSEVAVASAAAALQSEQNAQSSETYARAYAGQAATSAELATTRANAAAASATAAASSARAAAESAGEAAAEAASAKTTADEAKEMAQVTMNKIAEAAIAYPHQEGTITYDGTVKTPVWDVFYEPQKLTVTGDTSGTNAGTYTVTLTPKSGYYWWSDDTTTAKTQTWVIGKATIEDVPSTSSVLVYDGTAQSPVWTNYDSTELAISGDTDGTAIGTYTTVFTPTANYKWADGTTEPKSVTWEIHALSVTPPTVTNTNLTYTGSAQGPTIGTYDSTLITVTGDTTATNAASYTFTLSLANPSLIWSDETTAPKTFAWTIAPAVLSVPEVTDTSFTYDGTEKAPTIATYDNTRIRVTGDTAATAAGTYTVRFNIIDLSCTWGDGTITEKTATWTIAPMSLLVPTVTDTSKTYTGSAQGPIIGTYDTDYISATGDVTATNAGTHTITFTLLDASTEWTDHTTEPKTVSWTMAKMSLTKPSLATISYTYAEDTARTPEWNDYNSTYITKGGTYTATNAGSYTATATLADTANTQWSDLTDTPLSLPWTIAKAAGSMSLSKRSMSLDTTTLSDTVTVTRAGDGAITATSSDDTIATATVSGNVVTVTAQANGTATITIAVAEGTNYLAVSGETVSVTATLVSTTLNDNSWETISQVAQAGEGELYWNIGDVKMVTLNGKIGDNFTASNLSLGVFILDFNHKDNNVAENNIIFGGFKSALSGGKDVALIPGKYSPDDSWNDYTDGTKYFNMNHWGNFNVGGWKGSELRYDILGATSTQPSDYGEAHSASCVGYDATAATLSSPKADTFLAALPSDLRSKIRLRTHYVDNKEIVFNENKKANVTAVTDAVFLLAEFEIFGSRSYANQYEKNHQAQMKYYANGNAKVKYKHNATGTAVHWWECSPYYNNSYEFCCVNANGNAYHNSACHALGLAPAFKV